MKSDRGALCLVRASVCNSPETPSLKSRQNCTKRLPYHPLRTSFDLILYAFNHVRGWEVGQATCAPFPRPLHTRCCSGSYYPQRLQLRAPAAVPQPPLSTCRAQTEADRGRGSRRRMTSKASSCLQPGRGAQRPRALEEGSLPGGAPRPPGTLSQRPGSSGRRRAGRCPGPAVPASSVMCFRTSSSGTNFTSRAPLPFPSGWLMAGTLQAPPRQPRGPRPAPPPGSAAAARARQQPSGPSPRLAAPPSGGPGPRAPAPFPEPPPAPGRPPRRQDAEGGSRARQRATP